MAIRFHQNSMRSPRRRLLVPPVEEARPVSATSLCWSEARLAASCVAPTPVVAPTGLSDVRPISPEPLCGAGGEKTEETRARGEHSDGRVLSASLHHDNAVKGQRNARSEIPFRWRSCQRGLVEAPGVELGSENRQHTGMGIITQPRWWSAQAQVRGCLPGRERFGHQFLRWTAAPL